VHINTDEFNVLKAFDLNPDYRTKQEKFSNIEHSLNYLHAIILTSFPKHSYLIFHCNSSVEEVL